ncbi:reverse transcriptase domain-containing protein [Caerostris darwini]|uniref:Reverse transcriptase domain-containing protein n=1 Tax=Caerostris darwini TaxID=1538125 RepID=A0AAV4S2W6_9ARAC|nr:reverse transcriptase domain-containing protein [Caerostris darwini]
MKVKTSISNIINAHATSDFSNVNNLISVIQKDTIASFTPSSSKPCPNRSCGEVWWTKELQIKRSKTRALRRLYQKEQDADIRQIKMAAFKKCQAEYKSLIIRTKTAKFKSFIDSVTTSKLLTHKKKRAITLKGVTREDNSITSNIHDTYEEILNFHFPRASHPSVPDAAIATNSQDLDFIPVTSVKLEAVIDGIKPKKAAGIDGLPGEIVKELFFANPTWFTNLFNFLLRSGIFPQVWKCARVVLIPKEDRNLSHPQDYRPICILPCWGKVLNKTIAGRLTYFLESKHLLIDLQFGFRPQRSTINALQNIKDYVLAAQQKKHVTCLVSIDMANAFNSDDWALLRSKISTIDLSGYLKNIMLNFLEDRTVSIGDIEQGYSQGIPQGSCIGPMLWNIFLNDLIEIDFGPDIRR